MWPIASLPQGTDERDDARLRIGAGARAVIRASEPSDREAIRRFLEALPPEEARWERLMPAGAHRETLVESLCDSSEPRRAMTVLAIDRSHPDDRLVAAASYRATTDLVAEVAFSLDASVPGSGLGALLLERLARHAAPAGFQRFHATMTLDNALVRDVLRDAGFEVRSRSATGLVEVQRSLAPAAEGTRELVRRRRDATKASVSALLALPEIPSQESGRRVEPGPGPGPGPLALCAESGALAQALLAQARSRQLGVSGFAIVGDGTDITGTDLLEYWEEDQTAQVILLYLESFGSPDLFTRAARRVARLRPIVALAPGRMTAGSRAAGSHTAALAANDHVVDELFRQSGIIRTSTVDETIEVAACLAMQPLPRGRRLGIVTGVAASGRLIAHACSARGLVVPRHSSDTEAQLAESLCPAATVSRSVQLTASADAHAYERAVQVVLDAPEIDAVLVAFAPTDSQQDAEIRNGVGRGVAAARAHKAADKPVVACVIADSGSAGHHLRAGDELIPAYAFPENAVRALGKVAAYADWRVQPAGLPWGFDDVQEADARDVCRAALAERGDGWLASHEATAVLRAFGLPVAASAVAHSADEAVALASVIGFPVAAKLNCPLIQHKTDVGGVVLDIQTAQDVRTAFAEIVGRARQVVSRDVIGGVLVQAMVAGGIETIAGMTRDAVFGPLVGFGLGGVDVEMLGDVSFRVGPLTDLDADALLRDLRGVRILQGYRGRASADLDALRDVLLRISRMADALPEIVELDLNPVMALAPGMGARIVDARIRVSRPA